MTSFFNEPAVQSVLMPAGIALLVIIALKRYSSISSVIALIAGFCVTVYFVNGFSVTPVTSTRKIILISFLMATMTLVFYRSMQERLTLNSKLIFFGGAMLSTAMTWIAWPVLMRSEVLSAVATAAGLILFVLTVVISIGTSKADSTSKLLLLIIFAAGCAGTAIIGATALYGQLILPVMAVASVILLVSVVKRGIVQANSPLFISGSTLCALFAAAASIYANLPWVCLLLLAITAAVAILPFHKIAKPMVARLGYAVAGGIPAGGSLAWAFYLAGSPMY